MAITKVWYPALVGNCTLSVTMGLGCKKASKVDCKTTEHTTGD